MRPLPHPHSSFCSPAAPACRSRPSSPMTRRHRRISKSDPPKPVQIVEVPRAAALAGQLKPDRPRTPKYVPTIGRRPNALPPPIARHASSQISNGFIDAIQIWPYHPGALYQLYAAMGEVTDIALEPGEELSGDPAGGDTERWEVGSAVSGAGATRQVHLLIKPKRPDLSANLVITTNRRTYHLELHSTAQSTGRSPSPTWPLFRGTIRST